jgi:hypothetical protein
MGFDENQDTHPLQELEWLANYYKKNRRDDLAQEIFQQVDKFRPNDSESPVSGSADFTDEGPR